MKEFQPYSGYIFNKQAESEPGIKGMMEAIKYYDRLGALKDLRVCAYPIADRLSHYF